MKESEQILMMESGDFGRGCRSEIEAAAGNLEDLGKRWKTCPRDLLNNKWHSSGARGLGTTCLINIWNCWLIFAWLQNAETSWKTKKVPQSQQFACLLHFWFGIFVYFLIFCIWVDSCLMAERVDCVGLGLRISKNADNADNVVISNPKCKNK